MFIVPSVLGLILESWFPLPTRTGGKDRNDPKGLPGFFLCYQVIVFNKIFISCNEVGNTMNAWERLYSKVIAINIDHNQDETG